MKDIKSQPANILVSDEMIVSSANLAKVISITDRYEAGKNAPIQVKNENNTIIRRYSFDDNGGGYEGL